MPQLQGKTALVTGATSGIGKATAFGLAREGAQLVLLARDERRGEATAQEIRQSVPGAQVEVLQGDLASQASVRSAAKTFLDRHDRLHVLVNCAGVFLSQRRETEDGVEATFATNHLGHFLLANLLLDALRRGAPSRVVNVASKYGNAKIDFDDLMVTRRKFTVLSSVPPTKLAQVLFTQELAERLQGTGVTVNAVHPGLVADTRLLEEVGGVWRFVTNAFGGTPEKGADTVVWLATSPEGAAQAGKLWAKRRPIATPGQGSDPAARKRLWDESAKLARLI